MRCNTGRFKICLDIFYIFNVSFKFYKRFITLLYLKTLDYTFISSDVFLKVHMICNNNII